MDTSLYSGLVDEALAAGCPPEQLANFIGGQYIPQPVQLRFHAAARLVDLPGMPTEIGLGGARGGGKSRASFSQLALDDCIRCPGLKALYLRRAAAQAREQFEDLRRAVLHSTPHVYRPHINTLIFPNGSRIIIGSFRNETDVDKYLGLEYDVILIEEATTITSTKMQALRDSLRTSKPFWRPRLYNTTNPGGVGHRWYMNQFILPHRRGILDKTIFIPATVDDNAFVNAEYRSNLEMNTGWRLRAYRYGDWDIAAGQYFSTFRYDVHVRDRVRPIHGAPMWAGFDYGFVHPTSVHFLSLGPDGCVYVWGEHHASRMLPTAHIEAIRNKLHREHGLTARAIWPWYAGADVFAQVPGQQYTIADQYKGLSGFRRADTDRVSGASRLLSLLGDPDEGIPARLYIDSSCHALIETIPALEHDPSRPEDVLKVNANEDGTEGDDAYDSLRYGVMGRQWMGRVVKYTEPTRGNYEKVR